MFRPLYIFGFYVLKLLEEIGQCINHSYLISLLVIVSDGKVHNIYFLQILQSSLYIYENLYLEFCSILAFS